MKIKCMDTDGRLYVLDSFDGGESGMVIGPPDGIPVVLHNKLVTEGLIEAPDLKGARVKLLSILKELGIPKNYLNTILNLYQISYYKDGD